MAGIAFALFRFAPILVGFRGRAWQIAWAHRIPWIDPGFPRGDSRDFLSIVAAYLSRGQMLVGLFHRWSWLAPGTPDKGHFNYVFILILTLHLSQGLSLTRVGWFHWCLQAGEALAGLRVD